jgi:hypothetical protein
MSEMTKEQLMELAKAQKQLADSVGKTVEQRQNEVAIARELLKSVKERVIEEHKDKNSLNDRINLQLKLLDLRELETKQLKESIEANEQLLGEQDSSILALEQAIERKKALSEEDQRALEASRAGNDTLEQTLGRLKEQQKLTEDLVQKQLKQLKIQQDSIEAIQGLESSTKRLVGMTTGVSDAWKGTFTGQLVVASRDAGGFSKALGMVANSTLDALKWQNVLGSTLMKIQQSTLMYAKAQDSTLANFNKTTGAAGKYDQVLTNVNDSNRHFGVTLADASAALQALRSEMVGFRDASDASAEALATHVAQMEKMGVSGRDSAKMLNELTKGFQLGNEVAMDMQLQLVGLADSLGKDVSAVMTEFNSSLSELGKYGEDAIEVFAGLQAAAHATGVSMSGLMSVAKKFDTFDGAATSAAKLNSVLGANLDAYSLLEASEENRIRMLIESIEMGGKSWKDMGRFERQAVASAAGISDMSEANKIFGQSLSEYDNAIAQSDLLAISQKEQEERAKAAMDVSQSFQAVVESMSIAIRPLVEGLKVAASFMAEYGKVTTGVTIALSIGALWWKITRARQAAALVQAQLNMANSMKEIATNTGVTASIAAKSAAEQGSIAPMVQSNMVKMQQVPINQAVASSTWAAVAPTLAFGVAILMIGGAIAIAALGMAQLVKSFAALGGEQIGAAVTAIGYLVIGMVALGAILGILIYTGVLPAAAAGMLGFGAGILLMGAGIAVAALGLAELAPSIMSMALWAPVAAFGMLALGKGMLGLGVGLLLISESKLESIGVSLASLGQISTNFDTFSKIAEAIGEIAEALDNIDEDKTIAFGTSMDSLAELSKTFTATATVTAVGAAAVFAAGGARTAAAAAPGNRFEQRAIATGATGAGATAGTSPGQPIEVVLKINDREFARAVTNVVNEEI